MVSHDSEEKPPVVYGLGTVYSSTLISLVAVLFVFLSMLLGDGLAPSLSLLMVVMFFLLELHAVYMHSRTQGKYCHMPIGIC